MANNVTKVVTGKVRFSYAFVWKPQVQQDGGDPKYSVSIIIPKSDTTTVKKIQAAIQNAKELGVTRWGGKIPANLRTPLRDGDVERPDDPNYKNSFFINASSASKPDIVDRDMNDILDQSEFYSGCYGRASINFYPYDAKGNRGVAAGLGNLQKLADGTYLGGGKSRAADDFSDDFEDDEL